MIPQHRRIVMVGRALARKEQGPLIYSGFDLKHEDAKAAVPTTKYLFAFWYWVPPEQRNPWKVESKVLDLSAQEFAWLATGEIVEVRRNFEFPSSMTPHDLGRELLRTVWEPECIRRLGQIPEVFRGVQPLSKPIEAQRLEHERRSIVIAGS